MPATTLPEPGSDMREVSRLLGYHEKHTYSLVKQGKLNTYTGLDGRMKVSKVDLQIFLRHKEHGKK
jgi:hypothetical protein